MTELDLEVQHGNITISLPGSNSGNSGISNRTTYHADAPEGL